MVEEFNDFCGLLTSPKAIRVISASESGHREILAKAKEFSERFEGPSSLFLYVASFLNCRPLAESFQDHNLDTYCSLSDQVHQLLYKFNKKRLNSLLDNEIFASLINSYLSRPDFLANSGLDKRSN